LHKGAGSDPQFRFSVRKRKKYEGKETDSTNSEHSKKVNQEPSCLKTNPRKGHGPCRGSAKGGR